MNERVARQHEEQQQPLEDARHLFGYADRKLRGLAAEISQRQDETGGHDSERIEPAEERDDDSRESVTGRDHRTQLLHGAAHFRNTGEPRQRAGKQHREPDHPARGKAGKAPCPLGLAENGDFEALQRIAHHEPHQHRRDDREGKTPMRTPRGEHFGKDRIRAERSRFREVHALRVAPRATYEPVEKELGHIDQHQARQYLVRIHMRLQEGGIAAKSAPPSMPRSIISGNINGDCQS